MCPNVWGKDGIHEGEYHRHSVEEDVQFLYNELNPAVFALIKRVIGVCRRYKVETSICGQAGSKKEMVKFLVEKGIDSISVNADMAKEISDYVSEIENQMGEGPRQYQKEEKKVTTKQEEEPVINGVEEENGLDIF